jgi:hypothetical protein
MFWKTNFWSMRLRHLRGGICAGVIPTEIFDWSHGTGTAYSWNGCIWCGLSSGLHQNLEVTGFCHQHWVPLSSTPSSMFMASCSRMGFVTPTVPSMVVRTEHAKACNLLSTAPHFGSSSIPRWSLTTSPALQGWPFLSHLWIAYSLHTLHGPGCPASQFGGTDSMGFWRVGSPFRQSIEQMENVRLTCCRDDKAEFPSSRNLYCNIDILNTQVLNKCLLLF